MKTTTLAWGAVSLLQLAAAQPFRHHAHRHAKKDATVVNTVYADAPEVIVYVDQNGTPYSTQTEGGAAPASVAPVAVPSPAAVKVAAAPSVSVAASSSSSPSSNYSPSSSSAAPASPSSSSSSSSGGNGFGFAYAAYNADGSCKTQDQVNKDIDAIPSGYSLVRTYGTDCNQVTTVLSAAKAKGLKLFAGVFDLATLSSEIGLITSAASGDWSHFDTVSIGNELVNDGLSSPSAVIAAVNTARGLLRTAGFTGPVVTVDTLVASTANPSLCDSSDYCAVNCHPFYDSNTVAENSGKFIQTSISTLQSKLANKSQKIVVTETGWPSQGSSNGAAVPSSQNQIAAISSIKSAFTSSPAQIILLSAFNDQWKKSSPAQFNAEQFWGFLGNAPSSS